MLSHDEAEHGKVVMPSLTTEAHHLLNRAQQEAGCELEAIELTTAALRGYEVLEGGFISFDQHALMLSTIERLNFCV
jgi:hypothetical protein